MTKTHTISQLLSGDFNKSNLIHNYYRFLFEGEEVKDLVLTPKGIKWGTLCKCDLERPALDYKKDLSLYERLFNELRSNEKLVCSAFVIMVLPLSHHRPFICHVYFHKNGSAPTEFMENIKKVRNAVIELGLNYCGDGFDGDPKYDKSQSIYFDSWSKYLTSPSGQYELSIQFWNVRAHTII